MCKRNSSQKNKASMGCVREIPQIKMKSGYSPGKKKKKKKASTGCVREIPQIKRNKYGVWKRNSPEIFFFFFFKPAYPIKSMGCECVRETPHRKIKQAWDV